MPTETTLERSAPRFPLKVGKQYSQKFPFGVKTAHALKIREPHVITVTGKAFYDFAHAPADHSTEEERQQITQCGIFIR